MAKEVLLEAQSRVNAMSLLHNSLYHDQNDPVCIDVKFFIPKLLSFIENAYKMPNPITKELMLDVDKMDIIPGIDVCLLLNEIVNNAIKYAYPDHDSPILKVRLFKDETNLHLHVQDNGPGLPKDFNIDQNTSLGMRLIRTFVRKHEGGLKIVADHGVRYEVILPYHTKHDI